MRNDHAGSAGPQAKKTVSYLLFALAACGLYLSTGYSYVLFHTLIEIFCVFVMLAVFLLSWNARRLLDNHYFLFIAISFLPSSALELAHTFAYKGFGVFPGYDANLPTQLWIAFRYVFSLSFLVAPVFLTRKLNAATTLVAYIVVTTLLLWAIFSGYFPDCFIEGKGLTPFKIFSEYLFIAILFIAIGFLFYRQDAFRPGVLWTLVAAIMSAAAADAAFTQYLSVYGTANAIGHFFLFLSSFLIYRTIVEPGVKEPAVLLFRNLEQSREALKNSEERLRFALETCHIGAWDLDLEKYTAYTSLEHDRIFGYTEPPSKWTLDMFFQHLLPEYRAEVEAMIRQATTAKTGWTHECKIRRADGEIRWIWFSGNHHLDLSGRSWVAGIVQDITERKLAEEKLQATAAELQVANTELDESRSAALNLLEDAIDARQRAEEAAVALRESEEQFRTLAGAIPQLCWMAHADGSIFWYNQRWYEYTGTTPEQMVGWGWQSVHDPEILPEVIERWQLTLATGKPFDMVFPLRGSDGVFRHFLTRVMPLCDQSGKIVRWFGTNTDISEQRQTEEALQQAHRELAQRVEDRTRELREKEILLKEIHHRVKNNLQVISSLVSLQADSSGNEIEREGLRDVIDRVRSMALVHEKLYQSIDLARIDFAGYVQSLLNYLWRAHGSTSAVIGLTLNLEPLALPVDIAVPCGLILNELVGNALKHAFRGRTQGEVTVSLTCTDHEVRLRVHDDGVGLPPELDWRQSNSLGLRLVQMLAGQLHATIEQYRGNGTEFQLTFKLQEAVKDGEQNDR